MDNKKREQKEHEEVNREIKFIENIKQIHLKVQDQFIKKRENNKLQLVQHVQQMKDHKFHVGDQVWLYLSNNVIRTELVTEPFETLKKRTAKN